MPYEKITPRDRTKKNKTMENNNNNTTTNKLGPLGQSEEPSDWYSGGRIFDPRSGHIPFVEIFFSVT